MEFNELMLKIKIALNCVFEKDNALFSNNASEWSISHRLAVYLEESFPKWNIDCEYNRIGNCGNQIKKNSTGENIRPDIIIHQHSKKTIENNLLIIEIKKNHIDKSDIEKIKDYTLVPNSVRSYQYQYGLALILKNSIKESVFYWFCNGKIINF